MRISLLHVLLLAGLTALVTPPARGQSSIEFTGLNRTIPDGDLIGVVDAQEVSGLPDTGLAAVAVRLTLSGLDAGGFTGDLCVSLWHAGERAVLLNRPGRTATNPFGYSDSGDLTITLSAFATADIHLYRESLGGPDTPLVGPLVGTWQADGRTADPLSVSDTDPRTAGLDLFHAAVPNGIWALLLIDTSAGGAMQLDSWGLVLTPIPEPGRLAMALALGLLGWALVRSHRGRRE